MSVHGRSPIAAALAALLLLPSGGALAGKKKDPGAQPMGDDDLRPLPGGPTVRKKKDDLNARPLGDIDDAKPPPGKGELVPLTVMSTTPAASVSVDGEMVGMTPMDLPVPVTPGDHSIKVTRLGFAPFIDVFSTRGRKEVRLDIELVPVSGVVHVKASVAGARVLVDGKYAGEAPLDVEVDVGPRAIQVSKGGYKDFFENVMSVAGRESNLDVKLEELPAGVNPYKPLPPPPAKWYQKGWVWGVIAASAAAAAGGAVGIGFATQTPDVCTRADIACFGATR
jgi:hypothetical protein